MIWRQKSQHRSRVEILSGLILLYLGQRNVPYKGRRGIADRICREVNFAQKAHSTQTEYLAAGCAMIAFFSCTFAQRK